MRLRRTGLAAAAWATSGLLLFAPTGHAAPLSRETPVSREAVVQRAIEVVIRPGYEQLDKADIDGLNIALDSKQQELELVSTKHSASNFTHLSHR